MGTSAPFPGPGNKTPLLPDWADDDIPLPPPADEAPAPDDQQPIPEDAVDPIQHFDAGRFTAPRSNFTRYVHSNGTNQDALRRSIGNYVNRGLGGSRTAARRMSTSVRTSSNIGSLLRDIRTKGVEQVLRDLSLDSLIGKSPTEILLALTDVVCDPGGTIDEAIARDAYVETMIATSSLGDDLATLTDDQIDVVVAEFITRSIVNRIFIDIGKSIDVGTLTGENAIYLSQQTYDTVSGMVSDRLGQEVRTTRNLDSRGLRAAMKDIYRIGFGLLELQYGEL